jgi:hypothetical protein
LLQRPRRSMPHSLRKRSGPTASADTHPISHRKSRHGHAHASGKKVHLPSTRTPRLRSPTALLRTRSSVRSSSSAVSLKTRSPSLPLPESHAH